MIVFSIRAKTDPQYSSELLHFITSILEEVRRLDGCLGCHCYQSVEDDCSFYLIERWSDYEELQLHIDSELYSAISGAFKVLAGGAEVELTYTEIHGDGVNHIGGKNEEK